MSEEDLRQSASDGGPTDDSISEEETEEETEEEELQRLRRESADHIEKNKQLLEHLKKYMDHAKATVEAATVEKTQLMNEIEELKAENQSFEEQYEEAVNSYEQQIDTLKQEIRKKNQESIDNLSTLLAELQNIEEANGDLTQELQNEKKSVEQLTEEKDILTKTISQMETKLRKQEVIMKRQSIAVQNEQASLSNAAEQNEIVRHLMLKMEGVAELAMQLRALAVGETGEESIHEAKLAKEKKEHEMTRQLLEIEKKKSNRKASLTVSEKYNGLLQSQIVDASVASPVHLRKSAVRALRKGVTQKSLRVSSDDPVMLKDEKNNMFNNDIELTASFGPSLPEPPEISSPLARTLSPEEFNMLTSSNYEEFAHLPPPPPPKPEGLQSTLVTQLKARTPFHPPNPSSKYHRAL
ncbi:hypothetical protein PROFUN_05071 [Planoprotostelium fungivorum]|uniref:Uncharacterized protein n=1 Tax=Planoprotostelium fungivorum TaxID=1890364 RepID=A0A2P6NSB4_9EUKA|nr:hypothetical protein PROFUN_05071 [Planoprotostelium fungivorum]